MHYADYTYYAAKYGFAGTKLNEAQFLTYRNQAQGFVAMITFHRIEESGITEDEIPNAVKNAVCAVAEYLKAYDDNGGTLKASETVSKHAVTYYREQGTSKESEMRKIAGVYLDGTWLAYRGI